MPSGSLYISSRINRLDDKSMARSPISPSCIESWGQSRIHIADGKIWPSNESLWCINKCRLSRDAPIRLMIVNFLRTTCTSTSCEPLKHNALGLGLRYQPWKSVWVYGWFFLLSSCRIHWIASTGKINYRWLKFWQDLITLWSRAVGPI